MADPQRPATEGGPAQYGLYIGGSFVSSDVNESLEATNPATGEALATIPSGTRDDAQRAIESAQTVQPKLEKMTAFERAELCHELADSMEDRADELAEILAKDQGKPLEDAEGEIEGGISLFRMAAEDIKRDETATHPSQNPNKRIHTMRKPHGVMAVVTPWNYPVAIPIEYLAPGLACGNSLVWVPAPTTSVIALELAETFDKTSLPDGAINIVTGDGAIVGNEIVANDGTDAVGFTGSPATGEAIASAAGTKPVLLELGGNGPIIVLDDADIEAAVERAAFSCYANSGQDCAGGERLLVHEDVLDEFTRKFIERTQEYSIGNPLDDDTDLGPMNNQSVAEKVQRHITNATKQEAKMAVEGGRMEDAPTELYFEPTVLTDVTPDMDVFQKETFGPVAPITGFEDDDHAVRLANKHGTGLISGVFTENIRRAYQFADRLETGTVHINEGSCYWEQHTPFGGYSGKASGHGRLGGRYSIEEMSQIKNVTFDIENVRG